MLYIQRPIDLDLDKMLGKNKKDKKETEIPEWLQKLKEQIEKGRMYWA